MASFLRGKQTGFQHDLSASILPSKFSPDEQSRYGINSQISCLAFDPVQSLLAVATKKSRYGSGKIYVFGQCRVQKFLTPSRSVSFRQLAFAGNHLISLDSNSELSKWNLDEGKRMAGFVQPGGATCMVTDPMLDWVLIATAGGNITAYDLDRERAAPFQIPNFWHQHDPHARGVALVGMQLHPRDIGKLLISYTHGAVVYSFKQNEPTKFIEYKLPPGAPGGNGDAVDSVRKPRLTQAVWSPTGTFILTAHEDGSLVFWDYKDGRILMARSLRTTLVDKPSSSPSSPPSLTAPFVNIKWCCKGNNPEDTGLFIAGGQRIDEPDKVVTFLELGPTPAYATSSWQILSNHFQGRREINLETPIGADVVDFCLIPRLSPHYNGAQDPIAVIFLLSSGELITMSFPSGFLISPTNQLHPSLSLVSPYVTTFGIATMERGRWMGMQEKRQNEELLLKGGAEGLKTKRRYEGRNIIQVAHGDGTIRVWDVGHGDEMLNPNMLQVDVARAICQYERLEITKVHMAEATGELAAGTSAGTVALFRWGTNPIFDRKDTRDPGPNPGGLVDISSRTEPTLQEGLQPFVMYQMNQCPITALCVSNVGFVAAGSESGIFSIIDLRGPSIIFHSNLADFAPKEKAGLFKRHSTNASASQEYATVIEFSVMNLEGDSYSSLACHVGTNVGRVATFKLLPSGQSYSVKFAGATSLHGSIISICPIMVENGKSARATGASVAGLRSGKQVNGTIVVVTQTEIRIFKPATAKGTSKSFDDALCDAATVSEFEVQGFAIVGVFGDCSVRAFTLPGLKEIGCKVLDVLDGTRLSGAVVSPTGDVFGWCSPAEMTVVPVWGTGLGLHNTDDRMINPDLVTPPRPAIGNLEWLSGTQYLSPTDLDLLIGGTDRPPSKRMQAAAAAEAKCARAGAAAGTSSQSQEKWGEYLQRQLNERTEKLNLMGDTMDNLQDTSQGWADDVSKYISKQKRSMLLGGITKGLF